MWRAESPEVVVQPFDGRPRRVVVRERLAHTHEHDVGDALRGTVLRAHDLLDDLARVEVTVETGLARRAERARHRAPGLGRHAHRGALRAAHEHGLDLYAVARGFPQPLRGEAVGGGGLVDGLERVAAARRRCGSRSARGRLVTSSSGVRCAYRPSQTCAGAVRGLAPVGEQVVELGAGRAVAVHGSAVP